MIFGIGLPKTGTSSLAAALSELGFRTIHWPNAWHVRILWDGDWTIPQGMEADAYVNFGEWYYPKLANLYPGSKFILTQRPLDR